MHLKIKRDKIMANYKSYLNIENNNDKKSIRKEIQLVKSLRTILEMLSLRTILEMLSLRTILEISLFSSIS